MISFGGHCDVNRVSRLYFCQTLVKLSSSAQLHISDCFVENVYSKTHYIGDTN